MEGTDASAYTMLNKCKCTSKCTCRFYVFKFLPSGHACLHIGRVNGLRMGLQIFSVTWLVKTSQMLKTRHLPLTVTKPSSQTRSLASVYEASSQKQGVFDLQCRSPLVKERHNRGRKARESLTLPTLSICYENEKFGQWH